MAFNWQEFNAQRTKATDAKLFDMKHSVNRLVRERPPLRGFAVKWKNNTKLASQFYDQLISELFDYISNSSELTSRQRDLVMTWEKFQAEQKGPTAPVGREQYYDNVLVPLKEKKFFEISSHRVKQLDRLSESLITYFRKFVKPIDATKINFEQSWKELPATSVRGFPFHTVGSQVDDQIMALGGSTFASSLKLFGKMSMNVCFPAYRIQGKPEPGPAKLRLVNIPSVYYQYATTGLVKSVMEELKKVPMFSGWLNPELRLQSILNQLNQAKIRQIQILMMDFSKFDQHFVQYMRRLAFKVWSSLFLKGPEMIEYSKMYEQYISNQFIFLPDPENRYNKGEGYVIVELFQQLLSGIIDTQLDGSIVNALLQALVLDDLGIEIDWDLVLVLGDDAGIPVPIRLLTEYGYEGVLERISNSLAEVNFQLHPDKAYPIPTLSFLQKYYDLENDLLGLGTWARSLSSFIYRERFPGKLADNQNLVVMEIISQISILKEAYSYKGTDLKGFSEIVAKRWLEQDEPLRYLIQLFKNSNVDVSAHKFFQFLVKQSNSTVEQILEFNDKSAYDHTGLTESLASDDYGKVFPILDYLLKSEAASESVRGNVKDMFENTSPVVDVIDEYLDDSE